MNSKDKLAEALTQAGLHAMAEKARQGFYHDFESPLPDPAMQLDRDLIDALKSGNVGAGIVRKRHHNGDFDAGLKESEAWATSPEGRAAFEQLMGRDSPEAARERLRIAHLMGDTIRQLAAAIPNAGVVVLLQRGEGAGFDCATNIRQPDLIGLLRAYADHIETVEEHAPYDA